MKNDSTLSDDIQNDGGEQYGGLSYYEYASPIWYQGASPLQPAGPPVPAPIAPWAQMAAPPSWSVPPPMQPAYGPPQPRVVSPAYLPAQRVVPPPLSTSPKPTGSSRKRWWIFGIIGAVCALMVVLAGSYALLIQLSNKVGFLQPVATSRPTANPFQTAACPFKPAD